MAGPIVHLDLKVTNMSRAKKFYGALFKWKFYPMGPGYTVFDPGSKGVGGGLDLVKKISPKNSICPYFEVSSIEKTLAEAKKMKSKVIMPKTEIGGNHGFMAHLRDSEGNTIGLWSKK